MFTPLPGPPPKRRAHQILLQCAGLIALLTSLLVLDACSGFSVPAASGSTPPPATISSAALTISTALPSATIGAAYSASLTVSGGTAPYLFSLASGQLPTSVVLNANKGTFSGTPSTAGAFGFAVSVTDSKGVSKQQPLQITVANIPVSNPGNTFSNLQQSAGWGEYGQGPPSFIDCSPSPCDGIT
ncbi:MAG: Ig domain-containing protein, partial [Candidatus Sulfotelmatobacter sp.]